MRVLAAALRTHVSGCKDERAAARVLGYTQASWDNDSRLEKQPALTIKTPEPAVTIGCFDFVIFILIPACVSVRVFVLVHVCM